MNDEEFIIKFYACDNQEQFLKDVNHNLNCLQNRVEKLIQENNDLEELLSKQYCDGLRQGKFDNEMELINLKQINIDLQEEIDHLKQPQIFIDTEDMEERYGNDLYVEYLEKEKKHLQSVIDKVIELVNTKLRDVNLRYGIDNEFRKEYDELLEILRSKE